MLLIRMCWILMTCCLVHCYRHILLDTHRIFTIRYKIYGKIKNIWVCKWKDVTLCYDNIMMIGLLSHIRVLVRVIEHPAKNFKIKKNYTKLCHVVVSCTYKQMPDVARKITRQNNSLNIHFYRIWVVCKYKQNLAFV